MIKTEFYRVETPGLAACSVFCGRYSYLHVQLVIKNGLTLKLICALHPDEGQKLVRLICKLD